MENKKESLEERAKKLLRLKINSDFIGTDFDPLDIKNLRDKIPEINYLIEKYYAIPLGDTVGEWRLNPTSEGKEWGLELKDI